MIHIAQPDLTGNESRYLQECIETTFVSSVGPFVERFEDLIADASGNAGAVATASGTAGLHGALIGVGVGRDDLVIIPSYTFIASANAVAHAGADPWIMDVDPRSFTLDPAVFRQELESQTERRDDATYHCGTGRRVAAVMPVHAFGLPAEMDAINDVAGAFSIPVVADGAAAMGATYEGRPIGRTGAALTVFSFNGNKTITAGGGGAIVGDDLELLERVRHVTSTARQGPDYLHDAVGYNYRITNLQAAVGCAQIERLDELVAKKRAICDRYRGVITGSKCANMLPEPEWGEGSGWLSGIVTDTVERANHVRAALGDGGIEAKRFWMPVHMQPPYKDAPRSGQAVSEDIWQRVVVLPSSSGLTQEEQDLTIRILVDSLGIVA